MRGAETIREHAVNLVNALVNLSPSRNIVSQLILLLPEDLPVIERSYPEVASSGAKAVLVSLGVKFGQRVERVQQSFAMEVYKLIHSIFDWLDDEQSRSGLAKLTGIPINSIPNPYLEWAKLVLRKLCQLYDGRKVLGLLKRILSLDRIVSLSVFDEIRSEIGANPAEFKEILSFTTMHENEYISQKYDSSGQGRSITHYYVHSRYHLDFLQKTTEVDYRGYGDSRTYDTYTIRHHRDSLRKALEEVFV